jgi:hypothetical protein
LNEIYIAVDRPLGWLDLEKGRHTLSFVCFGRDSRSSGYNLGINDVVLERIPPAAVSSSWPPPSAARQFAGPVYRGLPLSAYREQLKRATGSGRADILRAIGAFGREAASAVEETADALHDNRAEVRSAAAWALSQMGAAAAPAVAGLEESLADANPRVRSLSAVALRSIGPKAQGAVPGLILALRDSAPFVRAPAADALGSIGPGAKAAVQGLSNRLLTTGETIYVLRSVAAALGDIGPDARSALPALQEAKKIHRVSATAQEAILKIRNKPVPSWF